MKRIISTIVRLIIVLIVLDQILPSLHSTLDWCVFMLTAATLMVDVFYPWKKEEEEEEPLPIQSCSYADKDVFGEEEYNERMDNLEDHPF